MVRDMTKGWVVQGFSGHCRKCRFYCEQNGGPQIVGHRMCSSMYVFPFSRFLISTLLETRVSTVSNKITKVPTIIELTVQGMKARYYLKKQK